MLRGLTLKFNIIGVLNPHKQRKQLKINKLDPKFNGDNTQKELKIH